MMARPKNPNWIATADQIRGEIAAAHFGQKNAIFGRYAEKTGYAVSSLKRDVIAANFIAEVESRDLTFANNLRQLGSTSVTELALLFRENPAKAIEAARSTTEGTTTRKDIMSSRVKRPRADKALRRHENAVEFFSYLRRGGSEFGNLEAAQKIWSAPPHSEALRLVNGELACAAYIQISTPVAKPDALHSHLALLLFYDHVVLGVPVARLPASWLEVITDMNTGHDRLHVLGRDGGNYHKLWPDDPWVLE